MASCHPVSGNSTEGQLENLLSYGYSYSKLPRLGRLSPFWVSKRTSIVSLVLQIPYLPTQSSLRPSQSTWLSTSHQMDQYCCVSSILESNHRGSVGTLDAFLTAPSIATNMTVVANRQSQHNVDCGYGSNEISVDCPTTLAFFTTLRKTAQTYRLTLVLVLVWYTQLVT